MREHPVPQDITGYQFHIIGNMTLKQFVEVGAGVVLGIVLYATNLPVVIKWPMIVIVVALGVMAAFVPIEERTLDHWIVVFVKSLYKPTKYYWRRTAHIPDAFKFEPNADTKPQSPEVDLSPQRRQRIWEYLTSLRGGEERDAYDEYQQQRMDAILHSFASIQAAPNISATVKVKPNLDVRVRSLGSNEPISVPPQAPAQPQTAAEVIFAQPQLMQPMAEHTNEVIKQQQEADHVGEKINVPELAAVKINSTEVQSADSGFVTQTTPMADQVDTTQVELTPNKIETAQSAAEFNADLPFPSPATEPNKPVGMILGANNELIPDAIIEILSEDGMVERAVKSNALGQFFVTTPLSDGNYILKVESDHGQFANKQLTLTGEPVPPLALRSQS